METLLAGWGEQTAVAVAGRHVLAIQDTSEINFRTKPERRRGLGEIGKGTGHGLLLHAMAAEPSARQAWWLHGARNRCSQPHGELVLDL